MEEVKETLDGMLLGDGCLRLYKSKNASYGQTGKHLEYINFIKETLTSFGISFSDNSPWRHEAKKFNTVQYNITSRSNSILTPHRYRWYPDGIKVVPRDIQLSPITVLHWYLGDGVAHTSYGQLRSIEFCTQGFTLEDCEFLCGKMNDIGFKTTVRTQKPGKYYLGVWIKDCINLLDYMGVSPVKCYDYKWSNVLSSNTYANPQPSIIGK